MGSESQISPRPTTSPTISHSGTCLPERPIWVIDWVRATCIATKFAIPTVPAQGRRYVRLASPHRAAIIIPAATTFAAAKKGASWAREMSWTSFNGELATSTGSLVIPSDSPSGRRAAVIRLKRSGASYIHAR